MPDNSTTMIVGEDELGSWFKPEHKPKQCTDCRDKIPVNNKAYYLQKKDTNYNTGLLCKNCMQKRKTAKEL